MSETKKSTNFEDKINSLLEEHYQNRKKLQKFIKDLEELSEKAKSIIPESNEFKNKFIIAERLDIASRLYDNMLKYRSEVAKQLKEEINIINNIKDNSTEEDLFDWINKTQVQSEL